MDTKRNSRHTEDFTSDSQQLAEQENNTDWFSQEIAEETLPGTVQSHTPKPDKTTLIISEELKEHYNAIISRRDEMLQEPDRYKDTDITAMLNATTKMLQALVATQEKLYNAETHARFQHIVIGALSKIDPDLANQILEQIDAELENAED